jgi:PAS domain S-box-containing protein
LAQVRYQAVLLENVRDAVVAWDLAGRITFWNRAAEVLFERSAEELLGRFQAGWYQQSVRPPVELPSSGMTLLDVERRFRRRSGEEIWLSSGVIALRNETDSLIGYMDVARDITGRKRLEAQVQVAQGQLVQAARLAAIGELASGVAHQISNPLTTVIGEAQLLLQESKVGRPGRESVEAIERAGWRAQQTVQRLLEFSRPAPETLDWVEINETIQQAMDLIGAQLEAAGIVIGLDLAKTLPRVHGQARQLEDLWINLLILARDALVVESGEGRARRVSVCSCLAGKSKVSVAVTDSGSAIPPERLASIFEPDFTGFQGGRAHGLELSICREIVRQHGGEIGVDSSLHHGTTFTVKLPAEVEG